MYDIAINIFNDLMADLSVYIAAYNTFTAIPNIDYFDWSNKLSYVVFFILNIMHLTFKPKRLLNYCWHVDRNQFVFL